MLSTLVFLLVLGVLIIVHEFGHFLAAKRLGVRIEVFSLGFGPRILSRKEQDTEYSINLIPLGGYVKLAGDNLEEYKGEQDEYLSKKAGERARIIFCGPLLNYVLGFLCFWLVFFAGYPALTTKVGDLLDGFGAKDAGIQAGDKIISVGSKKVNTWEELQYAIQEQRKQPALKVSFLRGQKEYTVDVRLKQKELADLLGQKHRVGLIGISPAPDEFIKVRYGLWHSAGLSLKRTWELTSITYKALVRMLTGKLSMRESVTGPLGIFMITSHAAHLGMIAVLQLVAVLSISLAIFNLLPLPVLDGGHILFLFIEKIRGRRMGLKAERIITQTGMALIVTLALLATYNDVLRFFGDRIAKFFK